MKPSEGLTVKQEIKLIDDAMTRSDENFLAQYGGFNAALQRSAKLQDLPESQVTDGVSINGFATWRAGRFAVIGNGFVRDAEDSSPDYLVRRGKAAIFSGCETHPATVAPAGSNRRSRGGNESAEAFGVEGRVRRLGEGAGRNE